MAKEQRGKAPLWLTALIIVLALALLGLVSALRFYADISDPADLFAAAAFPSPAPPIPTGPAAGTAPTPGPEDVLSAQADRDFMSRRTDILVLGIDESAEREDWGSFRTDTMLLVSIDFSDNDVCLVSIPRDSYVKIYDGSGELANPEEPFAKINNAFSQGGGAKRRGFEYVMETVKRLMGISVDYYCAFDMNVVKEAVDAMGGVDYDVDVEVSMNGRTLHPGPQHLDGQGVLDYCRQRKGSSDIARIDRQQRMLSAILGQLKSTGQIKNIPEIYSAVQDNIMTNLTFRQICSLALTALRMDMGQLFRCTIKGEAMDIYGRSCWCINARELEKLVKDIWGRTVTVDPEIDYQYIAASMEANRQMIAAELNAGTQACSKAYSLITGYGDIVDEESLSTLKAYTDALEKAIKNENKQGLDAYTPAVEQLCYSICNRYGITLY